jgi:hypothetical protein
MFNAIARPSVVGGFWLALVFAIVAASVVMGARLSTSAFLLAMCTAPMGVVVMMRLGGRPQTVAEVLYTAHSRTDRR